MTRRLLVPLVFLAGFAAAQPPAAAQAPAATPASPPAQAKIDARKLVDGVWASPTPGGANVGWFLLGDSVIAVDSGANEEVGRALVEEIQKTAGKKPRYLIVTHSHRDHAGGAVAFAAAGAQIVSAEKAAPGLLFVLDAARAGADGAAASAKSPSPAVVLTVSERTLFVGNPSRRAEIYYLGPGHTQGDLIVVLPNDGILFSGDLAVNGVLPYLRSPDVDPKGWERILPRLAALKIEKMVPGHGSIGPREGIADTAAYIGRVNEIAARLLLTNPSDTMIDAQLRAPENTIENVKITPDHVANVKAVYQIVKAERDRPAPTPTPAPQAR